MGAYVLGCMCRLGQNRVTVWLAAIWPHFPPIIFHGRGEDGEDSQPKRTRVCCMGVDFYFILFFGEGRGKQCLPSLAEETRKDLVWSGK
jgi:hypothetical protein